MDYVEIICRCRCKPFGDIDAEDLVLRADLEGDAVAAAHHGEQRAG